VSEAAARSWDAEYRRGRYAAEPPLAFTGTILAVLGERREARAAAGLYVGCGNGRNLVPLADAGLTLWGLDLSAEALRQLAERRPALASRLLLGDFLRFAPPTPFAYVVAIQVFQHGTAADAAAYFERAAGLLPPGGLLFLRVNAASTQVFHRHDVLEVGDHGGFTVRYLDGPKAGLPVHFYARSELDALTRAAFRGVHAPREAVVQRTPPAHGSWAQWEAVYERR
jgi:cyclopropane fatty-acyl-phospholipid synthase-like methyltransferase